MNTPGPHDSQTLQSVSPPLLLLGMVIVLAAKNPLTRETHALVKKQVDHLRGKDPEGVSVSVLESVMKRLI